MTPEEIARFDRAVPRYTSYPTAPHFTPEVDAARYARWLGELPAGSTVSLYVHVPFCAHLCWFCGCQTTVINRYDPVTAYLATLEREIDRVAAMLADDHRVVHLHWGGGTPTLLTPDHVRRLGARLRERFAFADDAEIAVEVDPRGMIAETAQALADIGVTRASLGVQDFSPEVQAAIGREQTYEATADVVNWLRAAGVADLNIDLMYGLPKQTAEGVADTVDRAMTLTPQRIALFGYAHVPWMKRHQRLIDESCLPGAVDRVRQAQAAERRLGERGYDVIGLDHFALPDDPLAVAAREGRLHRNFQGYTTDLADVLIGLGASAIGTLPQGYVQNAARTPDYRKRVDGGDLAVVRGVEVDADDRLRRDIIERLMCDLAVDLDAVCARHGHTADYVADGVAALAPLRECGAVEVAGGRVRVKPEARLLLRLACAAFDRRFEPVPQRHARAV